MLACWPRASCIGLADYPWCSIYLHVLLLTSSMAADISFTFIICVPFYIQFLFFRLRQISSKLNLLQDSISVWGEGWSLCSMPLLHWTCYNADMCLNHVVFNAKMHWIQAVFWGWNARIQKEISKYHVLLRFCYGVTMIFSLCYLCCITLHKQAHQWYNLRQRNILVKGRYILNVSPLCYFFVSPSL